VNNHFLVETVWVLCTYGIKYFAWGLAISFLILIFGSSRARLIPQLVFLLAAILVLWVAMFVAAEAGYSAWQSMPDPPDEAFSDTGPIFFLLVGWLPSFCILGIVHLALRFCWQVVTPKAPVQKIDTSQAINTVDRPPDDGNPYQSPGGSSGK
jgi:hypothetical protein